MKQRGSLGNDGELLDEDIFFDHVMEREGGWKERKGEKEQS